MCRRIIIGFICFLSWLTIFSRSGLHIEEVITQVEKEKKSATCVRKQKLTNEETNEIWGSLFISYIFFPPAMDPILQRRRPPNDKRKAMP